MAVVLSMPMWLWTLRSPPPYSLFCGLATFPRGRRQRTVGTLSACVAILPGLAAMTRSQGWGCEDVDLYARLDLLGLVDTALPVHLVRASHDDDLPVRFYDNKRIDAIWTTNQLYSLCKLDLMKIFRRPAPLEQRQKLYGRVRTWVEKVLAGNDGAHELRVTFRQRIVPIGATVRELPHLYAERPCVRLGRTRSATS